eukprot:TRINITY_DN90803_c0_g1_i1.p1 TRINITY_DN90803_c0_g1~~TRINITY_DN90803_c0_g1_i1.p1  ORF type:complete len:601 (-),score=96.22 TRINITY_DN90803_c0_g1_i1:460-2262(-)
MEGASGIQFVRFDDLDEGRDQIPEIKEELFCSCDCAPGVGASRALRQLGVVRGVIVRTRNIGASFGAALKTLVGGEVKTWTNLCEKTRHEALARMLEQAGQRGANGVVSIRYCSNVIVPGVTEVMAYGMAVSDSDSPQVSEGEPLHEGLENSCISRNDVGTSMQLPRIDLHCSLGVVQGLTVRSRNVFASIGAGFKSLAGGEIKTWTKMCEDARQQAYVRMVEQAAILGANGVVAVRFQTNEIHPGVTEVLAYGTAVSSLPRAPEVQGSALQPCHVTSSNSLPGVALQHSLGLVRGLTVRSCHFFQAMGAGFKTLVGGEVHTWSKLCEDARSEAFSRMIAEANALGAKGIVSFRYDCSEIAQGVTEVLAYGTAVTDVEPTARPLLSTGNEIPGLSAHGILGLAKGITVRSTNFVRAVGAGFKTLVGGEIRNMTALCEEARQEALDRLLEDARQLGAEGVVAVRFDTNNLKPGVIEVLAYGTAVTTAHVAHPEHLMAVSTTNEANGLVAARDSRSLGLVQGITVRSRNFAANVGAGLKTLVGGEIKTWTKLCDDARSEAYTRLMAQALEKGAKAIVALRYETHEIAEGVTEVLAYGTALSW